MMVLLCRVVGVDATAPKGVLSREELCDELVKMFSLDRTVLAQAAAMMDPDNRGISYKQFAQFMEVCIRLDLIRCLPFHQTKS